MNNTITGKELQALMIANRKSLTGSAKILGITEKELLSYFEYEQFEIEFIENIRTKLNLLTIINQKGLTPDALDLLESHKLIIKTYQELLVSQLDRMLELYVIIEKFVPAIFKEKNMEENNQFVKDFLVKDRDRSF